MRKKRLSPEITFLLLDTDFHDPRPTTRTFTTHDQPHTTRLDDDFHDPPPTTTFTTHDQPTNTHACCLPFVERGSALHSAPFVAPPPFEAFPEGSRRGACPHSHRLTPCLHQSGASCPTPFLHTKRGGGFRQKNQAGELGGNPRRENQAGEFRREKPRLTSELLVFSTVFPRGNRRSVDRGGWRSSAGVVAKMVVVFVGKV